MPAATIFALASGRPPAAIAVIRIAGAQAHHAAERIAGALPAPRVAAVRHLRHPDTGELLDEALVLRFDAPASATGDDAVEFHCHGGRAIADSVLRALSSCEGLRSATPGEFTRRAFENGRIDLTEAEGLADLIEAETETQRKAALAVADGALRRQIDSWRDWLVDLSARAEHAIDYADEEDSGPDASLNGDCAALASTFEEWLARPRMERIKDGLKVVVSGPPNAGKSSLINALVGHERAIVTEYPGTTRDHIEVPLALEGIPILLTDTAGLRESDDRAEEIGIARARHLAAAADILVWLGEPGEEPPHPRTLRLHAKADLAGRGAAPVGSIAVSAVTGEGLADLLSAIRDLARDLVPGDDAVALNDRQAMCMSDAAAALGQAAAATDPAIVADGLRAARVAMDKLTGRAGVEDMLDALFSRFCLGK